MSTLVRAPPRRPAALVERNEKVSASVSKGQGYLGGGDGRQVLVGPRLGFWVGVMMSSHCWFGVGGWGVGSRQQHQQRDVRAMAANCGRPHHGSTNSALRLGGTSKSVRLYGRSRKSLDQHLNDVFLRHAWSPARARRGWTTADTSLFFVDGALDMASSTSVRSFRNRRPDRRPPPPSAPTQTYVQTLIATPGAADDLLAQSEALIRSAESDLNEAQAMASRYGQSCEATSILTGPHRQGIAALNTTIIAATHSHAPNPAAPAAGTGKDVSSASGKGTAVLPTTGGHSNTDHIVTRSGCPKIDRIAELKRGLKRRARKMMPEERGQDRWDNSKKIKGSRRRRIKRDADTLAAPPQPPQTGYLLFVGQMTTKIRHDRPGVRHNQARVTTEISKLWKTGMSDAEKEYYETFASEAQEEYKQMYCEYKATGTYRNISNFMRLAGKGPWVRMDAEKRNALEREICSYDTVIFPPRPVSEKAPEWEKQREAASRKNASKK